MNKNKYKENKKSIEYCIITSEEWIALLKEQSEKTHYDPFYLIQYNKNLNIHKMRNLPELFKIVN